jgi:hypothetical protein
VAINFNGKECFREVRWGSYREKKGKVFSVVGAAATATSDTSYVDSCVFWRRALLAPPGFVDALEMVVVRSWAFCFNSRVHLSINCPVHDIIELFFMLILFSSLVRRPSFVVRRPSSVVRHPSCDIFYKNQQFLNLIQQFEHRKRMTSCMTSFMTSFMTCHT